MDTGLNLFTVASNHALDFGQDGLRTTLGAMRERELTFAGIGDDPADARKPAYLETDAGRVGLIDASTSVPPGGEAGVSTSAFDAECGINPPHVEWTYRIPPEQLDQLRVSAEQVGIGDVRKRGGETILLLGQEPLRAPTGFVIGPVSCSPERRI
jgi:poly-gamma-glutamate synthesis protein (capsule biosynthesis protein)